MGGGHTVGGARRRGVEELGACQQLALLRNRGQHHPASAPAHTTQATGGVMHSLADIWRAEMLQHTTHNTN